MGARMRSVLCLIPLCLLAVGHGRALSPRTRLEPAPDPDDEVAGVVGRIGEEVADLKLLDAPAHSLERIGLLLHEGSLSLQAPPSFLIPFVDE